MIQSKTNTLSAILKQTHELDEYLSEPANWQHNTGQRVPCFDMCQLKITWISNIQDVRWKPRLGISWSVADVLRDVFVVVVRRRRLGFMPRAMLTMKTELYGFPPQDQ